MTDPARPRLAFVQSMWHDDIVDRAKDGFTEVAAPVADLEYFAVPGAFEIPLFAKSLADTGRFDGIVTAGFVVDGGVYRHEFVADAVIGGLMRVQLDTDVPVFSCVLTPQQFHEHEDHVRFFAHHMVGKGREVARTALETLAARAAIR
jgi:6,7-dimethyl-8-ribityllumazine synthase